MSSKLSLRVIALLFIHVYSTVADYVLPSSTATIHHHQQQQSPRTIHHYTHRLTTDNCQTWIACPPIGVTNSSCIPANVPGTAMINLLLNGTFTPINDPFINSNLNLLPDISNTGPDYYTKTYRTTLSFTTEDVSTAIQGINDPHVTLECKQINYRSTLVINNSTLIPPIGAPPGTTEAVGMFQRFVYDLGIPPVNNTIDIGITVLPPDHYGNSSNTCKGCGQGGNHDIAMDVSSQYMLGWDWVEGTPDRNTGILDDVIVRITGPVLIRDPMAIITSIVQGMNALPNDPANITVFFNIGLINLDQINLKKGTLAVILPELDNFTVSLPLTLSPGNHDYWIDAELPTVSLNNVELWWPHTMGNPRLYTGIATFLVDGDTMVSDSVTWSMGFRMVSNTVDPQLGGQVFSVNNQRIYLEGGNYIASDQFARYNNNASRYLAEVRMHKEAGLNIIRLWAGSGGHGESLYTAGDQLGVFFMFEFPFSGDNNGRWAGSYDWPLDHQVLLRSVADSVRLVRGHPSLLFFCGGNELYPLNMNPPSDILVGMKDVIETLDPSNRFFIQSSMTYFENFDPTLGLAPMDGPYGMMDERSFFERNPGLTFPSNHTRAIDLPIAFQPEIGSASSPEYESVCRFFTEEVREDFPDPNAQYNQVNTNWYFHKYIPFTNAENIDTLYAYGTPVNASEYAFRAALAQYRQYQSLYEGFREYMFLYYGAIILWKSNSPWPAFRGALYDSYLSMTGSLYGIRAATGGNGNTGNTYPMLHIQLNPLSNTVTILNRGIINITVPLLATVQAYDISTGKALYNPPWQGTIPNGIGGNTVTHFSNQPLVWPNVSSSSSSTSSSSTPPVVLFRLSVASSVNSSTVLTSNDYWLSNLQPNYNKYPQNYTRLHSLRTNGPFVPLQISTPVLTLLPQKIGDPYRVNVTIGTDITAPSVAFAIRVSLRTNNPGDWVPGAGGSTDPCHDDRILPQWISPNNLFSLVPGEIRTISIVIDHWNGIIPVPSNSLAIVVDGFNVLPNRINVTV